MKIKAWIADKDAEALRCQQLLMEEEEAAQRKYVVPRKYSSTTFGLNLID